MHKELKKTQNKTKDEMTEMKGELVATLSIFKTN